VVWIEPGPESFSKHRSSHKCARGLLADRPASAGSGLDCARQSPDQPRPLSSLRSSEKLADCREIGQCDPNVGDWRPLQPANLRLQRTLTRSKGLCYIPHAGRKPRPTEVSGAPSPSRWRPCPSTPSHMQRAFELVRSRPHSTYRARGRTSLGGACIFSQAGVRTGQLPSPAHLGLAECLRA
jgi:hypothetical protein